MGGRYLIYRASSVAGMGHVLFSIVNCAEYARRHGRSLALDMRKFVYFRRDAHERFFQNFALEFPADLEIVTDLGEIERIGALPQGAVHGAGIVANDAASDAAVLDIPGNLAKSPTAFLTRHAGRLFHIALKGELLRRYDAALPPALAGGPVIGLYFRHGNGEFLVGRFDTVLFDDHARRYDAIKRRYVEKARETGARPEWRGCRFLVCSDNSDFVATMQREIPGCLAIAGRRADIPHLELARRSEDDMAVVSDAANDLFALSACGFLIYGQSYFARFAILNSRTLTLDTTAAISVPSLPEIAEKGDPDEAIGIARGALWKLRDARPEYLPNVYGALATALRRAGRSEQADAPERHRTWLLSFRHAPAFRESQELARTGHFTRAIERLRQERALLQTNPHALFMLARLLVRRCSFVEARDALAAAEALSDDLPGVAILRSQILWGLAEYRAALTAVRAAAAHDPADRALSDWLTDMQARFDAGGGRVRANVALGRRSVQSSRSRWSTDDEGIGAVNDMPGGRFGFQTGREPRPWWMVDLGALYALDAIEVLNRGDAGQHRARTLCIDAGPDETGPWMRIHVVDGRFGGLGTREPPLVVALGGGVSARWIRFSLLEIRELHLDQVRVFSWIALADEQAAASRMACPGLAE